MGRTTDLRREIKRRFIPYLADKGFACDMRLAPTFFTFRKIATDRIYVCDVQWEKYGRPRFVVNFGTCGPAGVVVRGEHIQPADIFASHATTRGRLAPGRRSTTGGWFRQDRPIWRWLVSGRSLDPAAAVVDRLIALFVEIEDFWVSGREGPHLRVLPMPPAVRAHVLDA